MLLFIPISLYSQNYFSPLCDIVLNRSICLVAIVGKDQVAFRSFVALCLSPYLFLVGVVAAPVRPLLSTLVVPVLLLHYLPVRVLVLVF